MISIFFWGILFTSSGSRNKRGTYYVALIRCELGQLASKLLGQAKGGRGLDAISPVTAPWY